MKKTIYYETKEDKCGSFLCSGRTSPPALVFPSWQSSSLSVQEFFGTNFCLGFLMAETVGFCLGPNLFNSMSSIVSALDCPLSNQFSSSCLWLCWIPDECLTELLELLDFLPVFFGTSLRHSRLIMWPLHIPRCLSTFTGHPQDCCASFSKCILSLVSSFDSHQTPLTLSSDTNRSCAAP
jgi:hypothetical protein